MTFVFLSFFLQHCPQSSCSALDGYEKCENDALEDIATEAFLRGCKEKEAALKAMEKSAASLSKAIKVVKTSLIPTMAYQSRQMWTSLDVVGF
jgi:hypothetical protein